MLAPIFRKTPFARNDQRNKVGNPLFAGARPGAAFPGWVYNDNGAGGTITYGAGIDGGVPYVDLKVGGTLAAGVPYFGEDTSLTPSLHAGVNGTPWDTSAWVMLLPGSTAALPTQAYLSLDEYDGVGAYLTTDFSAAIPMPAVGVRKQITARITQTHASAVFMSGGFIVLDCPGGATNFTLRVWVPSLVKAN